MTFGGLVAIIYGAVNMTAGAQDPARSAFAEGNKRFARPIRNAGFCLAAIGVAVTSIALVASG